MIIDTKLRYDCDSFLNEDFLNAYKKKNVKVHSYLNYGWLDGVDIIKECNRYLIELEKHRKNLNKDILEKYYKNRRKI